MKTTTNLFGFFLLCTLNGKNGENLCRFTRFKILTRDGVGKEQRGAFRFVYKYHKLKCRAQWKDLPEQGFKLDTSQSITLHKDLLV